LDLLSPHVLVNVAFPASLCKSARERGFAQEWPRGSRSAPLPDWFVTEGPKGIHGKGSLLCLEILKANHVRFSFRLPSQEVVEHRLLMLLMLKVATFTKSLSVLERSFSGYGTAIPGHGPSYSFSGAEQRDTTRNMYCVFIEMCLEPRLKIRLPV